MKEKFNPSWYLAIILGLFIGYTISEGLVFIQKNKNNKTTKRLIEKIEIYKKMNGMYPNEIHDLIPTEYSEIPTIYLGFEKKEIDYYFDQYYYRIEYQESGFSINSYSSETNKWSSYSEWAGS